MVPDTSDDKKLLSPEKADFTDTDHWRIFKIMSEFVHGFDALSTVAPAITIFGSARTLAEHPDYANAEKTAELLGKAGFSIISGGGPGIMEAANKGARSAGTRSVGVNIEFPMEKQFNEFVDEHVNFTYFFIRKVMLLKYSVGFVIFPGGFGTLDEMTEAFTLIQNHKMIDFPIVLFNSGYWKGLTDWMENTLERTEKIDKKDLQLFKVTDKPQEALDIILRARGLMSTHEITERAVREHGIKI